VYIPASFRVEEAAVLHSFIEHFGFATLVTIRDGSPFATHLPLLLDRERGLLLGHMARANPHWECLNGVESLAIFTGPHSYISPTWYVTHPSVPTWNYTAVHVCGVATLTSDQRTREIVEAIVMKYESSRANPWPNILPDEYRTNLLRGVVGFEMPIARIEGKFKLGQNRPAADREQMLVHLRAGGTDANQLAEFIDRQFGRDTTSVDPTR
jgi:transcriptional regulator